VDDAREAVRRTLTELKAFLAQESVPRLSEADTKAYFIEPIIAALGWIGMGVVTREYYVKNSQEFMDYVLFGSNDRGLTKAPVLAIETKALQTDLTEKHAAQLVQYCAVDGIEWGALTNARELQFFNTFLKPDLAAKRVMRLDLLAFNSDDEFDILFEQLWQLSQESVTTASVRTWLNQLRLDKAVRETVFNPGSSTIKQLRKALADAEIRATPQELVQWFRTQLAPPMPRVQGRIQPKTDEYARRLVSPGVQPPGVEKQIEQPAVPRVSVASLLSALQSAVNDHIPGTTWRVLKYYTAAEIDGRTFLAVKSRSGTLILGLTLPPNTTHPRVSDNTNQFNWSRMTRVMELHSTDQIDRGLLSLVEAAKGHSQLGQIKAYFGVTLEDLVRSDVLPPGTPLVFVGRGTDLTRAHISPAGEIVWQGNSYRSLSDRAFSALLGPGRASVNGWTQWYAELPSGRVQLAELRAKYLAGQASVDRRLEGAG